MGESVASGQDNQLDLRQRPQTFANNIGSIQQTTQAFTSSNAKANMGVPHSDLDIQQQFDTTPRPGHITESTNGSRAALGRIQPPPLPTPSAGQLTFVCDSCQVKNVTCDGKHPCDGCFKSFLQFKTATCSYNYAADRALQAISTEQTPDMFRSSPMRSGIQKQPDTSPNHSSHINDPTDEIGIGRDMPVAQVQSPSTTPYPSHASIPTHNIGTAPNSLQMLLPTPALRMPSTPSTPKKNELPHHLRDGTPEMYSIAVKSFSRGSDVVLTDGS